MTCSQATASAWESCGTAQGLLPYPGLTIPGVDLPYTIVATRNNPTGKATFVPPCEANLRARGLIYMKKNPGDCGAPVGVPGFSSGQIVGLSGQAASGVIGGISAAGALSGPATLGIGTAVSLAVSGIEGIFAHHAQAVANEESTICAVVNYFNPLVKALDAAVMSGQITPDQGVTYMRQVTQQAINGLQGIYKKCNAACYFIGYLKAHADFASTLYPAISPNGPSGLGAQAPGTPPATFGTPPGAVPDAGAIAPLRSTADPSFAYQPGILGSSPNLTSNKLLPSGNVASTVDYLNSGYNQQTGQSAQAADVPSVSLSLPMLLLLMALIIGLAVIL